jgi:hypothetical protein
VAAFLDGARATGREVTVFAKKMDLAKRNLREVEWAPALLTGS